MLIIIFTSVIKQVPTYLIVFHQNKESSPLLQAWVHSARCKHASDKHTLARATFNCSAKVMAFVYDYLTPAYVTSTSPVQLKTSLIGKTLDILIIDNPLSTTCSSALYESYTAWFDRITACIIGIVAIEDVFLASRLH